MGIACSRCLRRSHLLGHLAPGIAELARGPAGRPAGLLALAEDELIAAVGGAHKDSAWQVVRGFDHRAARAAVEAAGLDVVCLHAHAYPAALHELDDPPASLYFSGPLGRLTALAGEPCVAVVGTRRPSSNGRLAAYELGRGLSAAGITVVSGLAMGIDGEAHRGALDGGDAALAVLAGGADVPYPRVNRGLYRRLRERATILSELPPGRRAFRWSFPARNRIMAGLARLTVVVEAGEPSGSLISAALAADLGRDVCAVPGPVGSAVTEGSNRLLRDGAAVVRDAADVLEELYGIGSVSREPPPPPVLDSPLGEVLEAVSAGHGAAEIGRAAGLSAHEVRAALGRLELEGLIERDGLGSYRRASYPPSPLPASFT